MSHDRREQYKPPLTPEEARARRTDLSISVRKVKKEGSLLKRRALRASPATGTQGIPVAGVSVGAMLASPPPPVGSAYVLHTSPSAHAFALSASGGAMGGSNAGGSGFGLDLTVPSSPSHEPKWPAGSSPPSPPSRTTEEDVDALTAALLTAPTLKGALAAAVGMRRLLAAEHPPTELAVGADADGPTRCGAHPAPPIDFAS